MKFLKIRFSSSMCLFLICENPNERIDVLVGIGLLTVVAFSSLAIADVSNTTNHEEVVCKTQRACQKLSGSIQAQINELEEHDELDFDKLDKLQQQLIALENQKQIEQEKIITAENKKQDQMRLSQEQEIVQLREGFIEE